MKTKVKPPETKYPKEGVATVQQAAEFLKISIDTLYRRVKEGRITTNPRKPGEVMRIPWSQLHEAAGTK